MEDTEQALNEELAERAGDIKHDWDDEISGYKTTDAFCHNCHCAMGYTSFPCVPDFTSSLDACFKHLVPQGDVSVLIREVHQSDGRVFTQATINKNFVDYYGDAVEGQMKDKAALALCLAIKKLKV